MVREFTEVTRKAIITYISDVALFSTAGRDTFSAGVTICTSNGGAMGTNGTVTSCLPCLQSDVELKFVLIPQDLAHLVVL